jgi:hypothetical protein
MDKEGRERNLDPRHPDMQQLTVYLVGAFPFALLSKNQILGLLSGNHASRGHMANNNGLKRRSEGTIVQIMCIVSVPPNYTLTRTLYKLTFCTFHKIVL